MRPLPLAVRLWGKLAKSDMRDWCAERAGDWNAAIQVSSALRAAMRSMAVDETSPKRTGSLRHFPV
eukprot:3352974-Pyramimonas_sp.AAC.1